MDPIKTRAFLAHAAALLALVAASPHACAQGNPFGWSSSNPKIALAEKMYFGIGNRKGETVRAWLVDALTVQKPNGQLPIFEMDYKPAYWINTGDGARYFTQAQVEVIVHEQRVTTIRLRDGSSLQIGDRWVGFPDAACKPGAAASRQTCVMVKPSGRAIHLPRMLAGSADALMDTTLSPEETITRLVGRAALERFDADTRELNARLQAKTDRESRELQDLARWRAALAEGSSTNCGHVVERRTKMLLVQGNGPARWHPLDDLFPPNGGRACS